MSKVREICSICAFWRDGYCSMRREIIPYDVRVQRCEMFESKRRPKKTVFHQITASEETLAKQLVYREVITEEDDGYVYRWRSTIIPNDFWYDDAKALAATVAKLKEVCDA